MNIIADFDGTYYFLSNFYESPVMYDGILYGSSEAAFQAANMLGQLLMKIRPEHQ